MNVLFVCTGNICRSPSAALLLEQRLSRAATEGVAVGSAGTRGAPFGPPDLLVRAATDYGIDLRDHLPKKIDLAMITEADLIVGLERAHVREVAVASAGAFARTFTLREIVRLGREKGGRKIGEGMGDWLTRLHAGRRPTDLIGASPEDDVADPMGGSTEDYRLMLKEVSELTASLAESAWP